MRERRASASPFRGRAVATVSVATDVIVAGIGAGALLLGAYHAGSLRQRLRAAVQERRLKAYEGFWALMGPVAPLRLEKDGTERALSLNERKELFDATTEWYFPEGGGIFLSARVRTLYFTAKKNLLCADPDVVPPQALEELVRSAGGAEARGRLAIRQFSLIRWIMRFDLDVHTEPYNETLSRGDIAFLEGGGIKLDTKPFRGRWKRRLEQAGDA